MNFLEIHNSLISTMYIRCSEMSETGLNTSLLQSILENSITIIIALIAGLVALFQVKSNIVSSARINWIENLRTSVSEFYDASLSTALYVEVASDGQTISDEKTDYLNYLESHSKFFVLANRIKMYLNPNETLHKKLEDHIDIIASYFDHNEAKSLNQNKVEIELIEIVKISRKIFRKEWKRSKRVLSI